MALEATLLLVGGASGVGKTTVLDGLKGYPILNTGDLFKESMKVRDRDGIKNSDWTKVEDVVAEKIAVRATDLLLEKRAIIIDTHFAAKVHGKRYRIGLRRDLIYTIVGSVMADCDRKAIRLQTKVVLIFCDPYALLRRRRLDTSRKRELVPAECVIALRENNRCSLFYLHESSRARADLTGSALHEVSYLRLENDDLKKAVNQLKSVTGL